MLRDLNGLSILRFHDRMLNNEAATLTEAEMTCPIWRSLAANHRHNIQLWNEEDKARRTDVGDAEIAASKRLIDQHNQKRNDAVEALDEAILSELAQSVSRKPSARLSSETAGAMIDRLSILALKIYHMREQTEREDADAEHIAKCRAKHQRLLTQRDDLLCCLDRLLTEATAGDAYFKVYRQFKMYNDPTLNPYLYRQAETAQAA